MENKIDLRTLEEVNSTEIKNVVALNSEGNVIKADLSNVINAVNQHTDDIDSVIFEINETNDSVNGIKADLQALEERVDNIPTTGGTGDVTREEFEELDLRVEAQNARLRNVEYALITGADIYYGKPETELKGIDIRALYTMIKDNGFNKFVVGDNEYRIIYSDVDELQGVTKDLVFAKWVVNFDDSVTFTKSQITTTPIN